MISRIHQLVGMRSQLVIATHSPILMAYPNSRVYQIGANSLEQVSWRETEHYIVAKRFMNDTEKQLSRLLE